MRFTTRREDRRNLAVGFIGLLAIMMAHSVMETARDTLFLSSLPASYLPFAYLAIAVLAIIELKIHEQLLRHVRDRRRLLAASLVFGAFVTLGFWALLEDIGPWAPFCFYVWTGLLITVVLIEFWLLLDDAVTVTQAKRIFPAIAAGGVTGASLGSLLAEGVLRVAPPAALVFVASGILTLAAVTAFGWESHDDSALEPQDTVRASSIVWLLKDNYLARILALVLFGTIALTVVDFIFKSTVADQIPTESLGPFFARFYLGLNSVALLVQVAGAGWLLRAFGAHRSSALLPALFFGGALGLAVGPVLPFAVALKAVDGSLRHTLYRSSIEVLYLPLDRRRRERAKGVVEVFGHRVGQAVGSLLIIAAVGVGMTTQQLALALVLFVGGWLAAIMSTRRQYVDEFRDRLRTGVIDTRLELEELDLHSLEVLQAALNSPEDAEVLAALDIFDRHGRADLIPVLVLYHPSLEVRTRALEAFAEASDTRFVPIARRMLAEGEPEIRAAALRALTAVVRDRELLEQNLDVDASIVRATAVVGLLALDQRGDGASGSSSKKLDEVVASPNPHAKSSLARAIRHEGGGVFNETLIALLQSDDLDVQLETLRAMEANPDARYLPRVLPLLASSDLRAATRRAIVAIGPEALTALDAALASPETPPKVRRRIPHTIILFEPEDAAAVLLARLEEVRDGGVRSKILRALVRLRAEAPSVSLDEAVLNEQLRGSLLRIVELLRWRSAIERDGASDTPDAELLRVALEDKERAALERAFWVMGLQHPEESFSLVWRGIASDNARLHAASREVIEATLSGSFRDAVLAIVDDGEPPGRRARAAAAALGVSFEPLSLQDAVLEMKEDRSEVILGIARHYAEGIDARAGSSGTEVSSLV